MNTERSTISPPREKTKKLFRVSTIGNGIQTLAIWASIIFFSIVGMISLIITTTMPDYTYNVQFTTRNWWIVLILSIVVVSILSLLSHKDILQKIDTRVLSHVLVGYSVIFGVFWAALANVWPEWDPFYVLKAAQATSDPSLQLQCPGDEVSWILCPGGYLERSPYQIPLVLFDKFLYYIFGTGTYLAFEFINVLCTAATFYLLGKLAEYIFSEKRFTNTTLLLCFAFLPLIFYITFAYGNTLALPFLIAALILQVNYFKNRQLRYAVISLVCLVIGLLFKSSMIYVLAAMVVIWIIAALKDRSLRDGICIILAIVFYITSGFITSASAEYLGLNPNNGEPKTVWIAMGLQKPSKSSPNNYGWYNGYPLKWAPENYDLSQIEVESKESIKQSISDFKNDPAYAWTFFSKKFLSEWTDPLYESLLASNWSHRGNDRPIMSEREISPVLHSIYYGKANKMILLLMDTLQFLLLFGTTVTVFYKRKELSIHQIAPAIIPLGMALLYLLWEAQSQYIMPAYIVMIPFAGAGLVITADKFSQVINRIKS
ncbi:glycosyltransferase family 39 protein [Bifidobacterium callimiconis]|uniref:Glycosyltransferase RgtA/B/C/D-like domain-containing protein n=1 Tax=Bifidobacterium callimiconis TaxID=2306973 RepID=A0A430FDM4_9BIFI|nr:glycosyltransferase family 39 protein [Bifidobacterium callimiconis]RSX50888.1 hypothetical protein D2E23_1179 [Bifidobacterium callimiconis]